MHDFLYTDLDLKVGLEIHQQLDTGKKLFCNCKNVESEDYPIKFQRKLRISKGELGEYDPAALFESTKSKTIVYYANPQSSCLVEQDEEPPHDIDAGTKELVILIATMLNSKIFTEIYTMRKLVIDGSNTSGFQRTMLISHGGYIETKISGISRKVGVQTVCLEEDAAKLLGDKGDIREYSLDRLGTPLVEIALEPISVTSPNQVKDVALYLGRLLRTTRKVARGIGTIRQDVNVSVRGGRVVEVKGVQQLDQLEKVIGFEAKRQYGLLKIAERLQDTKIDISKRDDVFDVTETLAKCESKIIKKSLKENSKIRAVRVRDFAGMFAFSPQDGVRLGKEIGQLVRFFGVGGVFHSDELPKYGIEESDVSNIRKELGLSEGDAFLIVAAPEQRLNFVIDSIIDRIYQAGKGVPAETRLATSTGETVFLRPRPGASRMYPETDIRPISVTKEELEEISKKIPKSWEESIYELEKKYNINHQLAEQVFDSEYLDLFERVCRDYRNVSPNFVASVLCSTITSLERKGLDRQLLDEQKIEELFTLLDSGKIAKETVEIILEDLMSQGASTVAESVQKRSFGTMEESELRKTLDDIIQDNSELIKKQGTHSIGPLMGIAMKKLRGKVSGEAVNKYLAEQIDKVLSS